MNSEIMMSGYSFQVILLLILIICISVFFYFEIRKINLRITSLEMNHKSSLQEIERVNTGETKEEENNIKEEISISNNDSSEIINDIILDPIHNAELVSNMQNPLDKEYPKIEKYEDSKKESDNESDNESINESINESDNKSDNESDNESDNKSINESDNESDNESINSSVLDIEEILKELQELSVKELKSILQEKELPVSGNKTTMIQRIIESLK